MKHDYNATAIAADTIATTGFGFIAVQNNWGGTVRIDEVVVEQTDAADAEFNVLVDGSNLFSSTQSVASSDTPESLTPDQNRTTASALVDLSLDVTASSGTGTSELFANVLVDDGTGRAQ